MLNVNLLIRYATYHNQTTSVSHTAYLSTHLCLINTNERRIVIRSNDLVRSLWIGICKGLGGRGEFLGIELELESLHHSVLYLHEVNLRLGLGAPEIQMRITLSVGVVLNALAQHHVLPQRSDIGTKVEGCEIADDGVSDAVVVEVYLAIVSQLSAQVPTIGRQSKNDETLLQQVDITLYRGAVDTQETAEFVVRHLLAYLHSQCLKQTRQHFRLTDAISSI